MFELSEMESILNGPSNTLAGRPSRWFRFAADCKKKDGKFRSIYVRNLMQLAGEEVSMV